MSEVDSVQTPSSAQERARIAREALIGKSVQGRYVLRSLLGHGGMGAVYEAEHLGIGKRVAIKFVDSEFVRDEEVVTRFAREARAMSTIESPHIVSIFDAGTEDGRPYLVMELLRGEDLGQRLRRTTRVALPEALHIIAMVLKGLAKAHAAGIVHRDLKPDNIFLVHNDGDPVFAKIVDFGVSKIERPRNRTSPLALTGRGTVLGTPFYMSPEQAQAAPDLDGRADLFSVGAILFECLAGRPPHTGETYEQIILSICMTDAPPLRNLVPEVPPPVAAFVARALTRDRTQRFESAEGMLAALHELSPEEKTRVPLEPVPVKTMLEAAVKPPSASTPVMKVKAVATQIGGSAVAPTPTPARAVTVSPPTLVSAAAVDELPLEPAGVPRKRSGTAVIIISLLAAVLGVGITFVVVAALGKNPEKPENPAPSTSASFWTAVSNMPVASSVPGLAASSAPPVAVPAPAPKPRSSVAPPAPKPSAKRLDISRDLP